MFALVSPLDSYTVIDVKNNTYTVEDPYFWVECPDSCKKGLYYFNKDFYLYIRPYSAIPIPGRKACDNKRKAIELLTSTDWVTFPDVINTSITPHLLNQDEFIEYRRQLRIISLDPIDEFIDWPVIPVEKWAK